MRAREKHVFWICLQISIGISWRLLSHLHGAWGKRVSLISNLSPTFGKKRGRLSEKRWRFSKNRWRFSEKRWSFFREVRSEGPEGRKGCRRSGESTKASVGQRDEIKESFGHVEGKPYFCRE